MEPSDNEMHDMMRAQVALKCKFLETDDANIVELCNNRKSGVGNLPLRVRHSENFFASPKPMQDRKAKIK